LKNTVWWIVAVLLTLISVIYQRKTGPTYPLKYEIRLEGQTWSGKLLRSHSSTSDLAVRINFPKKMSARISWKEYPSDRAWKTIEMEREGAFLVGTIPRQPAAGKVHYYVEILSGDATIRLPDVIARFKGDVPAIVLIPHIILMFAGMLTSSKAGIDALRNNGNPGRLTVITFLLLVTGGLGFGCIVQYYAFGQPWTGWPVGYDLTDNKVAVALIAWLVPLGLHLSRKEPRYSVIVASVFTLLIFLIPHSLMGSEYNYSDSN